MGGYQVPGRGPGDEGFDEEGYDESQRAEILEATNDGPSDGNVLTDMAPDFGADDDDDADDLRMVDDETGEEDEDAAQKARAISEDEIQDGFDEDDLADDDDLDDADGDALDP
ncbi:DNA primase [Sphingomonas sp. IBVSS2]|uniref:DNA primase n=1 Tax=Sphingomonas sp. IBVSS2 TaxID=1985172 RepID=UPI000A2D1BB7|nr:DNA primase [Sphingomonas sp. IBVSS2]OSZ70429.1 DNA primase [Sphingomonas sp. IBVSS2]